ncbi:hypothetical protein THRCLA_08146 [Thraustotheca clavata]|uniref:WW domain-containing protein n=1 Tax=Thraustotheca clavata TaxID=74557 RepID=A0A1V9Z981_9STRA|nr:hypothetical protein THRCLA_08146 [Thraustotheca clavata]
MNTFGKLLGHGTSSTSSSTSVTSGTGLSFASTIGPPSSASSAMSAMSRLGGFMTKVPFPLGTTVSTPTVQKIERASHDGESAEYVYEYDRVDGNILRPSVEPKKYGDASAGIGQGDDVFPSVNVPDGFEWTSEWEIDLFSNWASVDKDGWTYGADWTDILKLAKEELSHATKHPNDTVRRRRYVRYCKKLEQPRQDVEVAETPSWTEQEALRLSDEDIDDPFSRTAQKKQSGFRTMNFASRAGKDYTKDYANITDLNTLPWLVSAQDASAIPSDEAIREKTANLEERIKKASEKSAAQEQSLRTKHQKKVKDVALQQKKLSLLIEQYRKVKSEYDTLQANATELARVVDQLRKEATEKDILANEDQRVINADMQAANQALEEKAKALVTARIRYKRDNKSLSAAIQAAKQRLEQMEKANANDDPVAKELEEMVEKLTKLHAKVEAVKQHRLAIEEERKEMFSQVVEKKSDLRLQSKMKLEATLHEIDAKLESLKQEQASLLKAYANKPEGDLLKQLNNRRSEIRNEVSMLKGRRAELVSNNNTSVVQRPQVAEL